MSISKDDLARHADDIRDGVMAGIQRRRTVRRRITAAAVSGGFVLAAAAGVGTVLAVQSQQTIPGITCYSAADLGSDSSQVIISSGDGLQDVDQSSVANACGSLWQSGVLGAVPDSAIPDGTDPAVAPPAIAVCLGDGGFGLGFPIFDGSTPAEVCAALGLEPWRG